MNKIVIIRDGTRFSLSKEAIKWFKDHDRRVKYDGTYKKCGKETHMERHDPLLIQCIEELGEKANTRYSKFEVIEIEGNKYFLIMIDWGGEICFTPDMDWRVIP